jgi:hypothetical protein
MDSPSPPQLDYQTPGNRYVRIRRYTSEFELRLAAARLESEGIHTQVAGEPTLSGMGDGVFRSQDLFVLREEADRAGKILDAIEADRAQRSSPPAAPVVSYYTPTPPSSWIYVRGFPTVGSWHSAAAILKRHNITPQMRMSDANDGAVDMLVPQAELESARELLGVEASAPESPPAKSKSAIPPRRPIPAGPLSRQTESPGLGCGFLSAAAWVVALLLTGGLIAYVLFFRR